MEIKIGKGLIRLERPAATIDTPEAEQNKRFIITTKDGKESKTDLGAQDRIARLYVLLGYTTDATGNASITIEKYCYAKKKCWEGGSNND
ncbi:MAG: hypothetical protein K0R14_1577 [Burkholderiales bacterium]|jgi:hypothetical protein|nr:hypothetical protein [Burkholderiales bacterium]